MRRIPLLSLLSTLTALSLLASNAAAEDPMENPILLILQQADKDGLVNLQQSGQEAKSEQNPAWYDPRNIEPAPIHTVHHCADMTRLSAQKFKTLKSYQDLTPFREAYTQLPNAENLEDLAYAYAALGLARESQSVLDVATGSRAHGLAFLTAAMSDQTGTAYAAMPQNALCGDPSPLWGYLSANAPTHSKTLSAEDSVGYYLGLISEVETLPDILQKIIFRQLALIAARRDELEFVTLLERKGHIPSRSDFEVSAADHQLVFIYALSESQPDRKKLWLDYLTPREGLFQFSAVQYARKDGYTINPISPEVIQSLHQTHAGGNDNADVNLLMVSEHLAQNNFKLAGEFITQQISPQSQGLDKARDLMASQLIKALQQPAPELKLSALEAGYTFHPALSGSKHWPDLQSALINAAADLGLTEMAIELFQTAPPDIALNAQSRTVLIQSYRQEERDYPAEWEEGLSDKHFWMLFTAEMRRKNIKGAAQWAEKLTAMPYKDEARFQLSLQWRDWTVVQNTQSQPRGTSGNTAIRQEAVTVIAGKQNRLFKHDSVKDGQWASYQSGLQNLDLEISSAKAYLLDE